MYLFCDHVLRHHPLCERGLIRMLRLIVGIMCGAGCGHPRGGVRSALRCRIPRRHGPQWQVGFQSQEAMLDIEDIAFPKLPVLIC